MEEQKQITQNREIPTEQKIPRIYNNAIEKMIDEMPSDYSEMQKARHIYIQLGKLLAYDERYTVGNSGQQRKLFRLAKERVIAFNEIKENKKCKGICLDLNRLYANVLNSIGIQAYMNIGYGPMPHDNVTARIDGKFTCFDLQRDLIHIQLNCMTDFFAFYDESEMWCDMAMKTEEIVDLDKSINHKNYNYKGGEYISKIKDKFESSAYFDKEDDEAFREHIRFKSLPIKSRVEEMLHDIASIPGIKDLGYTERTRVYCDLLKRGLGYGERQNFRIDNLYSVSEETKLPQEVIEVFTVIHMDGDIRRFSRYIYDHVEKEYVEISNRDLLDKIEKEGLKSKKELAGMRKFKKELKNEAKEAKKIFSRLNRDPMNECEQVFNFDQRPITVVDNEKKKEPEIVVDLSEEKLHVVEDEKKTRKTSDMDIIDY